MFYWVNELDERWCNNVDQLSACSWRWHEKVGELSFEAWGFGAGEFWGNVFHHNCFRKFGERNHDIYLFTDTLILTS